MKNRVFVLSLLILIAAAALAACSPGGAAPEQSAAEATQQPEVAEAEIATFYVGPELVECTGVAPQMCMQVKRSPDAEYQLFYDSIEGFTFEPGYEWELLVEITPVDNPPADASSLSYRLVEVVSQTPVETSEALALEGPRWVLVEYLNGQGETVAAVGEAEVTAEFSEGTVGGNAGCNSYSGGYTLDGNNLTIGAIASTMMACFPDEVMQQEMEYLNNLQAAASYTIEGDRLLIANADGVVTLTFVATEPISLTGRVWEAINYNNGNEAVVGLITGTTITANFAEDGSLTGSAGCNNYMTSFTVDGDSIAIEPAASTKKLCPEPEGVMEQEAQYLAALATAATYRIDGPNLELRDADGAMVANFVAGEAMP